jgi:outer membrane protein OmpA-like peptidoglycan-associated protein
MAACKCKEVECEECPEWIFTLADLIMCMMGLFVILWVLKPGAETLTGTEQNEELVKVLANIREAFGYEPNPESKDPIDLYMLAERLKLLQPHKGPGLGGQTDARPEGAQGSQRLTAYIRNGTQTLVGARIPFAAGQADLAPEALKPLDDIAGIVKGWRIIFMVKGHADPADFGETGGTPQQRMDLSLRRAQQVADYLVAQGVAPETLRVIGCSTFEPVTERAYTPEARRANQRVEVHSLDQLVDEFRDQARAPPAGTGPAGPAPAAGTHTQTVHGD